MASPDLSKHTFNLRHGDVDFLSQVYLSRGVPVSVVIRELVAKHVDALRRRETMPNLDLGVDLNE